MFSFRHNGNLVCPLSLSSAIFLIITLSSLAQTNFVVPRIRFDCSETNLFFALGMIESGNNDRGIGKAGEVSRYQIHPAVWKIYSASNSYQDPDISLQVARRHWAYLSNYFREKAGRSPSMFDMYVLWNTRFGYYARRGFNPGRLDHIVRDRAQRFVNLVNR